MSTLVMVRKGGDLCMAAETLETAGSRKQPARYVARPEKILRAGASWVGLVGWSVSQVVLESAFAHGCPLPEVRDERELFEWSRTLHRKLKDEYFLDASDDGPYESSHLWMFVMNRHGLFALSALRCAEQCIRFTAVGSGSDYALGAMHAAYELDLPADEIARMGVEAGIEFDDGSGGPITVKRMKLEV